MNAVVPGGPHSWVDLLPAPYDQDPIVVVVLSPKGATYQVCEGKDLVTGKDLHVAFLKHEDRRAACQVLKPVLDSYFDHKKVCEASRIVMAHPAHIGRVSEIPQAFLSQEDLAPLLFLRDNMSEEYLNLRQAFSGMTPKKVNN